MQLLLENVRCFQGQHSAPLAPLTLLVGENSTGKSTFLAMARAAWDAASVSSLVDFNEPPFRLGSFNDIATLSHGRRASSFSVGFKYVAQTPDGRPLQDLLSNVEVEARFYSRSAQPVIREWKAVIGRYSITAQISVDETKSATFCIKTPQASATLEVPSQYPSMIMLKHFWQLLPALVAGKYGESGMGPFMFREKVGTVSKDDEGVLQRLIASLDSRFSGPKPYATAPIRTRPERIYEPLTDRPTPEGDHIPMVLARQQSSEMFDKEWQRAQSAISEYGQQSGLFAGIDVYRLGMDASAQSDASLPFQLRVGMSDGMSFNLVDVGYGVSQVLPVLVDSASHPNRMLLLQQPEVHLHPRAQAQLGSFLGALTSRHRSAPILVETHSDYLLDRVRMDVRDRRGVSHADVLILYFDRVDGVVRIHPIYLDSLGNLLNVPDGYRSFFMNEERRFLQG